MQKLTSGRARSSVSHSDVEVFSASLDTKRMVSGLSPVISGNDRNILNVWRDACYGTWFKFQEVFRLKNVPSLSVNPRNGI